MKHKTLYFGFGFSLLALLVLRVCQLAFAVEAHTGFYKPEYENFWIISAIAIVVGIAIITCFSFVDVDAESRKKESKWMAIFYLLAAVGFGFKAFFTTFDSTTAIIDATAIAAMLSLASMAIYLIFAYFTYINKTPKTYFLVVPSIFWIFELISIFIRNNDVSSVPERVYETLSSVLCILFSLYLVKEKGGMLTKITTKIMVALSLVTSVFCLILSLPNILLIISGNGNLLHNPQISSVLYLAFGIYIPAYIFSTFNLKKS